VLQCGIALTPIWVCQPFAIFFMQNGSLGSGQVNSQK
jgi:hypothetical protein